MAWCTGFGSSRSNNMYTSEAANAPNLDGMAGGQVIQADFNGDGVQDTVILGGNGGAPVGNLTTSSAFQSGGGYVSSVPVSGFGATGGGYVTNIDNGAVGVAAFTSMGNGVDMGNGFTRYTGDINGDGVIDSLELSNPGGGQIISTGTSGPAPCNAGPPRVLARTEMGYKEVNRTSTTQQGEVKLVQVGSEIRDIRCPKTVMTTRNIQVPVKRQHTRKVPRVVTGYKTVFKNEPYTRTVPEEKWIMEEYTTPEEVTKTIYQTRPVTTSHPQTRTRYVTDMVDVPRRIKVARKVDRIVEEPDTHYIYKNTVRTLDVEVPNYAPMCDSNQILQPAIDGGSLVIQDDGPISQPRGKTSSRSSATKKPSSSSRSGKKSSSAKKSSSKGKSSKSKSSKSKSSKSKSKKSKKKKSKRR